MRTPQILCGALFVLVALAGPRSLAAGALASEGSESTESAVPGSPFGELLPEPYRSFLRMDLNEASTELGRMGVPAELSESAEKDIRRSIARSQKEAHPDDLDEDGLPKPQAIVYSAALGAAAHLSKKAIESSQPVPQELHADTRYHFGKEPYVVLSLPPNLKVMHAAMKQAARDAAGISSHFAYRTHQQDGAHPLAHVPVVPEDYQQPELPADPLDPRAMDAIVHRAFDDAERQLPPAFDPRLLRPAAKPSPKAAAPKPRPAKPFRIAFPPLPGFAAHLPAGHAHAVPDDHPLGALLTDPDIDIPFILMEEASAPEAARTDSLSAAIGAESESIPSQGIFEYMAHAAWDGLKRLGNSISSAVSSAAASLKNMASHIEEKAQPEPSALPAPKTSSARAIGTVDGHEVFQSVRDIYSEPPSPISDDRPSPLSVLDRMTRHGRNRKAPPAPRPAESLLPVVDQFKTSASSSAPAPSPAPSSAPSAASALSPAAASSAFAPSAPAAATAPAPSAAAEPKAVDPKAGPAAPSASKAPDSLPPLGVQAPPAPAPSAPAATAVPAPQVSIVKPTAATTPDFVVSTNAAAAAGPARSNAAIDAINREAAKQRVSSAAKEPVDPALKMPIRKIIDSLPSREAASPPAEKSTAPRESSAPAKQEGPTEDSKLAKTPAVTDKKEQPASATPKEQAPAEGLMAKMVIVPGAATRPAPREPSTQKAPAPAPAAEESAEDASAPSAPSAPAAKAPSPSASVKALSKSKPASAAAVPAEALPAPAAPSAEHVTSEDSAVEESTEDAEPLKKTPPSRDSESTAWKHELLGLGLFTPDQMRSRAAAQKMRANLMKATAQPTEESAGKELPAPAKPEAEPEPLPAADAALLKRLQANYNFDRPAPRKPQPKVSKAPKAPKRGPAPKSSTPDPDRDLHSKARLASASASVTAASELVSAADQLLARYSEGAAPAPSSEESTEQADEAAEEESEDEDSEGSDDGEAAEGPAPLASNAGARLSAAPAAPAALPAGLGLETATLSAMTGEEAADPFTVVSRLADDAEFNADAFTPVSRSPAASPNPQDAQDPMGVVMIPDPFMGFTSLARPAAPSPAPGETEEAGSASVLEVGADTRVRSLADFALEEILGPRVVM